MWPTVDACSGAWHSYCVSCTYASFNVWWMKVVEEVELSKRVCANLNFFFCSVWCRPVQTARTDSCLDWAGASRPLAAPQQRQVRPFSWLSSHLPLTSQQHTTVNPSLLSQSKLGFPLQSQGNRETFWPLVYYFAFINRKSLAGGSSAHNCQQLGMKDCRNRKKCLFGLQCCILLLN